MSLTLIRHGQSLSNRGRWYSGQMDVPLTEHGLREAEAAGLDLRGRRFDHVFTSSLQRATVTANLVLLNAGGPAPGAWTVTDALNERNEGAIQGLPRMLAVVRYGAAEVEAWETRVDKPIPEGETIRQCHDRVVGYYRSEIEPLARDAAVLVVAHSWVIRALLAERRGLGVGAIPSLAITNCQIIDDTTPVDAFAAPPPVPQDL